MDDKVYCEDCKWFDNGNRDFTCDHPNNIKMTSGNWLRKPVAVTNLWPDEININNNCKWFEEKER